MAAQAQAFQQALVAHERIRKSTDLPLFHGDRTKDAIEPQDFLNRFETASQIANWVPAPAAGQPPNEARKCQELFMLLRSTAAEWWKALELLPNFDMNVWDNIRTQFLITFAPRYTARTACLSFTDLVQQPGENVSTFFLRVTKAYRLLKETRPPEMMDVTLPLCDLDVDLPVRIAAANAHCRLVKEEGIEDMGRYVIQAMFTAGLQEELRIKTMEARLDSHAAAYQYALNLECIIKDKRGSKPLVTAVRLEDVEGEYEEDDEDEELLEQVNAIRFSRGKKPIRFASKGNHGKVNISCRYCKKLGHFQRDCLKRKRENGAMVDAQGKPFKVSSLEQQEEEEHEEEEEQPNVNSIAQSFYGINSIADSSNAISPEDGWQQYVRDYESDEDSSTLTIGSGTSENADHLALESDNPIQNMERLVVNLSPVPREKTPCPCYRSREIIRRRPNWFQEEVIQDFLVEHEMRDINDQELKCTCSEQMAQSHIDQWPEDDLPAMHWPEFRCPCERALHHRRHKPNWFTEESQQGFLEKHEMENFDQDLGKCTCEEDFQERMLALDQWPDHDYHEDEEPNRSYRDNWMEEVGESPYHSENEEDEDPSLHL
jgi:Retrotransposon gag protein